MSQSPPTSSPVVAAFLLAGEARINLLRLAGVLIFYANHLLLTLWLQPASESEAGAAFAEATRFMAVVILWSALVGGVHVSLKRGGNLAWTGWAASLGDVLLVTILAALSGGPKSPFLLLYVVVIAATPLRANLGLVYATTLAAVTGYLALLGHYVFVQVGIKTYYAAASLRVSRAEQSIYVLTLIMAGLLAGQIVRQLRRFLNTPTPAAPAAPSDPD